MNITMKNMNRPLGNYFYRKGPRTEHRATRVLEV